MFLETPTSGRTDCPKSAKQFIFLQQLNRNYYSTNMLTQFFHFLLWPKSMSAFYCFTCVIDGQQPPPLTHVGVRSIACFPCVAATAPAILFIHILYMHYKSILKSNLCNMSVIHRSTNSLHSLTVWLQAWHGKMLIIMLMLILRLQICAAV